ncbi:MAG: copper amine oxidase N-terminal domain-containing protein [candidate division WS1 bacterium]|jgi:hypothetical protein|nr:copper amine oxidase N-terminal domain-containing protein [candidate division WS1 bacterium]
MERLGSLFWSGVTVLALVGILSSIAAPIALAGPIVRITDPAHEQTVQGQILVDVAFRTDSDQPISRIDLLIDGELARQYPLDPPRLSGRQSFNWDFTSLAGTKHTISARAIDVLGEIGMATITVTVAGARSSGPGGQDRIPPVVNIYYPAHGAEVSGQVPIKADASDNVGVKYVFFYINGKVHKLIMNSPPYEDLWDTTNMPDGPAVLQVKTMDEAENEGASAEVTVFVSNRQMTTTPEAAVAAPPVAASPADVPVVSGTGTAPQQSSPVAEEPSMATATGGSAPEAARVGYVAPIGDYAASCRTSSPERMLAGLPRSEQPVQTSDYEVADIAPELSAAEVASDAVYEPMIASSDYGARMTMPRRLAETSSHIVTAIATRSDTGEPLGPQLASGDAAQRVTMPRTRIEHQPTLESAAELRPGWVVLEPSLELTPDRAQVAARITAPLRSLTPTEVLAMDMGDLDALVVEGGPEADLGSIIARLEVRTTSPQRMLEDSARLSLAGTGTGAQYAAAPAAIELETVSPEGRLTLPGQLSRRTDPVLDMPLTAFEPRTETASEMRIAVLPERASRAAIPADGRLTLPGRPNIAPVASTAFEDIQVLFNSDALELLASPEMREGISMAPLREIFEHSDGVLYWYPVEKRVHAARPGTEMSLKIGDPRVTVNDQERTLQVAPYIKQGRTMVPLQFLADTLDVTITFNPETGQICLTSNEF